MLHSIVAGVLYDLLLFLQVEGKLEISWIGGQRKNSETRE